MIDVAIVAIQVALTGANFSAFTLGCLPAPFGQVTTQLPTIMFNGSLVTSNVAVIAVNILSSILIPVAVTPTPAILGHSATPPENSHQHSSNQCTFHFFSLRAASWLRPLVVGTREEIQV